MGTPSVSEAAALLCAGAEGLLVEKTICGDVTVAVALVP
jgi:cobalamin biosynthesis protein CbiG